jgi:hypothetical protein
MKKKRVLVGVPEAARLRISANLDSVNICTNPEISMEMFLTGT